MNLRGPAKFWQQGQCGQGEEHSLRGKKKSKTACFTVAVQLQFSDDVRASASCCTYLGRGRRNPGLAHNLKMEHRKRSCKQIQETEAQGNCSTLPDFTRSQWQNRKLNSVPLSLGLVLWPLDRSSHHSDLHWGNAKPNSYVHSAHKTWKLSMGTDGHTGPNAFISIICCRGSEVIMLQFSFILELPIQCLIESFETSEG